jgi:RNA polymerase-binding protein DksA
MATELHSDTLLDAPVVDDSYFPSEQEEFMNPRQQMYFRKKLLDWKKEILANTRDTIDTMKSDDLVLPDVTDRATYESEKSLELRARDRQRKLVSKIDAALARLDDGTYGYCDITGEPIGLRRLDARPIATLSIEAQEMHERREKVFRDD